ncbi:MAG: hypothetical protein ACREMJ_04730 [Gemmatimonadales bacterium]
MRIAALLILLVQLQPIVLAALCRGGVTDRVAGCEQTVAPAAQAMSPDAPGASSCASPVLCGVGAPAVPNPSAARVAVGGEAPGTATGVTAPHPIEPTPPLLPPPLA